MTAELVNRLRTVFASLPVLPLSSPLALCTATPGALVVDFEKVKAIYSCYGQWKQALDRPPSCIGVVLYRAFAFGYTEDERESKPWVSDF